MEPSQVSSPINLSTPSSPCCTVVVYDIIMTSHVTADRRHWMNTRNWPNNTWTHHLLEDCEMWLKALEEASLDYYFCQTYQFCIFSWSSVLCFQQSASLVPTVSAASRLICCFSVKLVPVFSVRKQSKTSLCHLLQSPTRDDWSHRK